MDVCAEGMVERSLRRISMVREYNTTESDFFSPLNAYALAISSVRNILRTHAEFVPSAPVRRTKVTYVCTQRHQVVEVDEKHPSSLGT